MRGRNRTAAIILLSVFAVVALWLAVRGHPTMRFLQQQ
jgi:hypothetical protein